MRQLFLSFFFLFSRHSLLYISVRSPIAGVRRLNKLKCLISNERSRTLVQAFRMKNIHWYGTAWRLATIICWPVFKYFSWEFFFKTERRKKMMSPNGSFQRLPVNVYMWCLLLKVKTWATPIKGFWEKITTFTLN